MAFDGDWRVSEGFGDDGHGRDFGEFVERAKSGSSAAEGRAGPLGEAGSPQMSSGRAAAEHPAAVGPRGRLIVRRSGSQLAQGHIERVREGNLDGPEGDGDVLVGDLDVVPGEFDDVGDLLAKDQDEDRGRTVSWAHLGRAGEALDDFLLLGCVESGAGAAAVGLQLQGGIDEVGFACPVEEA